MRATILALALSCVAGCGSSSTTMTDMAMSMPDMTAAHTDMSQLSCLGLITCLGGCTTATCQQNCQAMASGQAVLDAVGLSNCINMYCLNVDGGADTCMSATDTSPGCKACVSNATQGPQCSSQLQTCATD